MVGELLHTQDLRGWLAWIGHWAHGILADEAADFSTASRRAPGFLPHPQESSRCLGRRRGFLPAPMLSAETLRGDGTDADDGDPSGLGGRLALVAPQDRPWPSSPATVLQMNMRTRRWRRPEDRPACCFASRQPHGGRAPINPSTLFLGGSACIPPSFSLTAPGSVEDRPRTSSGLLQHPPSALPPSCTRRRPGSARRRFGRARLCVRSQTRRGGLDRLTSSTNQKSRDGKPSSIVALVRSKVDVLHQLSWLLQKCSTSPPSSSRRASGGRLSRISATVVSASARDSCCGKLWTLIGRRGGCCLAHLSMSDWESGRGLQRGRMVVLGQSLAVAVGRSSGLGLAPASRHGRCR